MGSRRIAVWLHQHKEEAADVAADFVTALQGRGFEVVAPAGDLATLGRAGVGELTDDVELSVIFGGDGSILRAAEWALPREVPLLGVNMGHVGFLAELEASDLDDLARAVTERDYTIEERLALETAVTDLDGEPWWSSVAVNEVSIEKSAHERMLEVLVSVNGIPLSRWGSDGVLVSSPTGSTAYAFSAGGPIIWPDLDALLLVPICAHALFSRPVVLGPDSTVDVELVPHADGAAVVWCDGRRSTEVAPGGHIRVWRSEHRLRLARWGDQPFTKRLVRKFGLQVEGWRGAAERHT